MLLLPPVASAGNKQASEQKMAKEIRLQVALAQLGFASRRGAVAIIKAGRAKVNGRLIIEPGQRVDIKKDTVTVDGKTSYIQKKVYFVLNKPSGVTSTVKDKHAGQCVLDLIKQKDVRFYPVGRLDKDTTGLILLTNDGELFALIKTTKAIVGSLTRLPIKNVR